MMGMNKHEIKHKHQTSITIDEETLLKVKEKLRERTFRNQSHLFEVAVQRLLERGEEK